MTFPCVQMLGLDAQRTAMTASPAATPVTLPSLSTVATSVLPDAKKHLAFASAGVTVGASFMDLPTDGPVGAVQVTPAGCLSLLAGM